jgi:regulator of RNase E activity RraA
MSTAITTQAPALSPTWTDGLAPNTRAKLAQVGSANVANVLLGRGFRNVMMPGVAPLTTDQPQLVGPAYTLRFIPAREDLDSMVNYGREDNMHRRAIEECPEGSVLVIDAFGSLDASSMGDMMAARLKYRGAAGVVTDGGYRDSTAIAATGLPCYQVRNAPPATPIALHPVALNGPVGCAGVAVYPGDVLVGDQDGVAVIPAHLAEEVADEALAAVEYEAFAARHLALGRSIFGLFPATPESRAEYDAWVAAGRPELETP